MIQALTRAAALPARLLPVPLAVLALVGTSAVTASAASSPAASRPGTVVFLVDTHQSTDDPLAGEHQAVLAYAGALPSGVRTALITFSAQWRLVLGATTDRGRLAAAVRGIRPAGGTANGISGALTAAVALVSQLHATSRSRFVVFSNAEELRVAVRPAAVPTDVVIWRFDSDDNGGALRALARASHGRVVPPGQAASLAAAVAAVSPRGKPHPSAASPTARPAANPAPHQARPRALHLPWPLIAVLATVFLALLLLVLLATGSVRHKDLRDLTDRIAAVLALPDERVWVTRDPKHAGNIIITVQTTDPWAAPVTHPALPR